MMKQVAVSVEQHAVSQLFDEILCSLHLSMYFAEEWLRRWCQVERCLTLAFRLPGGDVDIFSTAAELALGAPGSITCTFP